MDADTCVCMYVYMYMFSRAGVIVCVRLRKWVMESCVCSCAYVCMCVRVCLCVVGCVNVVVDGWLSCYGWLCVVRMCFVYACVWLYVYMCTGSCMSCDGTHVVVCMCDDLYVRICM